MKKFVAPLMTVVFLAALILPANVVAVAAPSNSCATIADGTILDSAGNVLTMGFDQYGYNYQAHLFVGTYDSVDRKLDGKYWGSTGDFVDDQLIMKWSDDWLSNGDCNLDGKLDRGAPDSAGFPTTSQGWETNQVVGDYDSDGDGTQDAHYTDFAKIVWVGPGGSLWGQYELIQEVYNDPVGGYHGISIHMPAPGFGLNDQWTQ